MAENPDESLMGPTLNVVNQLQRENIIGDYAIGGSIAIIYYAEPMFTDDLDIFCFLPQESLVVSMAPIYKRLQELGYEPIKEGVNIEGVNVQFLTADTPLLREAVKTAAEIKIEDVPTRVFQYEYALAVKAEANRPKDWGHIVTALASSNADWERLEGILQRYQLLERWKSKIDD